MPKSKNESENSSLPLSLGIFEKAWKLTWVLRFIYLMLFLDISLLLLLNKGIFNWSFSNIPTLSFGDLGFIIIGFGLFSSLFLLIATEIFNFLFIEICCQIPFIVHNYSEKKHYGYITLASLNEEALQKNSEFLYRIYCKKYDEYIKAHREQNFLERISLGVFILFICDGILSSHDGTTQSIVDFLWILIKIKDETVSHGYVAGLCFVVSFLFLLIVFLPREIESMVYYPPLYNKKEEEKRRKRERQREYEREIEENMYKYKK